MLYPPKGDAEHIQWGSNCFYLYIIWLRKRIWHFQNHDTTATFFPWKCFIPRREMQSISSRGPIVFTYTLFGIVKVYWTFKNIQVFSSFWNLENVLSPEGSCESRTEGGPIVLRIVLFWLYTDFETIKITLLRWPFFFLKMFYFRMGWGGMGWDGVGRVIKSVLQFSLYFVGK